MNDIVNFLNFISLRWTKLANSIHCLAIVICVLVLVNNISFAQKSKKPLSVSFSHQPFDSLLQHNVRGGEPYYQGFETPVFYRYCDSLATVQLDKLPKNEHSAFWLNAINSCVIRAILLRKGMRSLSNYPDFYTRDTFVIAGYKNSLQGLISKALSLNPHPFFVFGIFHGSKSAPPLLPRAFHPQSLESVLRSHIRTYLRSEDGAILDIRANVLSLPFVFERYAAVWGADTKKLLVFVRQFLQPEAEAYCAVHADSVIVHYSQDNPLLVYRQSPPKQGTIKPWDK